MKMDGFFDSGALKKAEETADMDGVESGGSESASAAAAPLSGSTAGDGGSGVKSLTQIGLSYGVGDYTPPSIKSSHDLKQSFRWDSMLNETGFVAAPVSAFRHAPMADCWENIIVGVKVEVKNRDSETTGVFSNAFWVATVLRISGYSALLRYEGFGQDPSQDFWMNLCSEKVHPVGWCATKGKPLIPPKTIQAKYHDWKDFLVKRLTGARTLPSNFYLKVWESVDSIFRPGMKLEVVDKMRICQVRVATIMEIVGRRLYLQYDEVDHDDRGFWCHEESPLIHPVGWARRVGHQIVASQEYFDRCAMDNLRPTDCTPDMFPEYKLPPGGDTFDVGMKIEAVDPLNLATICVATVMKVLRFGYIMVRIDGYENDVTGSDWFCYHQSSPLIFPPGFAERNNLALKPPTGFEETFSWYEYLKATRSQAAKVNVFLNREHIKHGFKVGMKIEATDQMDPRLVCVSTISRVVGRLLKVHFDGWEDEYDQWMDCENVDIYPVGWAELVGHKLEGPRMSTPAKKEKRKPVGRKGKKRTAASNGSTTPTALCSASSNAGPATPVAASAVPVSNGRKARKVSTPEAGKSRSPTPDNESISSGVQPIKISISSPNTNSTSDSPPQSSFETKSEETVVMASAAAAAVSATDETSFTTPEVEEPASKDLTLIPRLVDSAGQAASQRGRDNNLDPSSWTVEEVATFLEINECATLADAFSEQEVDGAKFLSMAKEDVMKVVNNKIGPCLKVENLLKLLKARMNPAQARYLATMTRKST